MSTSQSINQDLVQWTEAASSKFLPLPPSVYTCPDWFKKEIETIFYKEWINVGHVSELNNANDYLTIDIYDKPVLVVCDDKNKIRAFSNVCQHRSSIIAKGKGSRKLFACPYHAWSYGSDGKLKAAPHMDMETVKDVCLPEYKVEIWQGLVFVSLDTEATLLAPRLEDLESRFTPYNLEGYKVIHRETADLECNWKLLVENFCENYHLFCVHAQTLEPNSSTADNENWSGGPGFNHTGGHNETLANNSAEVLVRLPNELHDVPNITGIFPSFAGAVDPKSLTWLIVLPTGPQTLNYTLVVAKYPENADDEISEEDLKAELDFLDHVMEEDKTTLRLVQRGITAGTGQVGPLHPFEQTNWEFGHYLARTMLGIDTIQRPDNPPWPTSNE